MSLWTPGGEHDVPRDPEPGAGGGPDVADLALTIPAHPTLSESVGLAAEVAEGTVTDLPPQRRKR